MANRLFLVVPCYNEQEVLPAASSQMLQKLQSLIDAGKIAKDSRICLVDDCSKDSTWSMIEQLHAENELFCGVKLSRNRGH
ncbi:MAG: glycosyltransferase, partial [Oscillospiraceae bacterium]|nr:glycosyltransferase [Oscillospiraceae bacterium]